jgi:hypothetical protein
MYVNRPLPPRRSNRTLWLACGCLAVLGFAVILVGIITIFIVVPLLPGLALQTAGFSPKGNTAQVFANVPPQPTVQVQNPIIPTEAVINLGSFGSQNLPQTRDYTVEVGNTASGPTATVSFTEQGLMDLCYQRSDMCGSPNAQYRNPRIDLRPGGAIIYADVFIQDFGIWQPIGVVLRLDGSQRQFAVAGVDVSGTLYDLPPTGLGETVVQIATTGNQILQQLSLQAGGGQYQLTQVLIDDTTLTLVMH